MALTSYIGSEPFIVLRNAALDRGGAPELPGEECEILMRPGVDGISVRTIGKRAQPFQLIGQRDVLDLSTAHDLHATYQGMRGKIYTLTWNGINWTAQHNVQIVVLRVHSVRMERISTPVGGLVSGAKIWMTSVWDLVTFDL